MFFALLIGHALADFPLQGGFLAAEKNRKAGTPGGTTFVPRDAEIPKGLWVYALTAHALIQGGMVWLITGNYWIGLAEFVLHWLIDFAKRHQWLNFHTDQFLHVFCKAVYVAVLAS